MSSISQYKYPERLYFDCLGELVVVRPAPGFWPRAKGTCFELYKYKTDKIEKQFVPIDAKLFRRYLAPIFDLAYLPKANEVNMLNLKRIIRSWVTESIVWEQLITEWIFLGNIIVYENLDPERYITYFSFNIKTYDKKQYNLFNDSDYCGFRCKFCEFENLKFKTGDHSFFSCPNNKTHDIELIYSKSDESHNFDINPKSVDVTILNINKNKNNENSNNHNTFHNKQKYDERSLYIEHDDARDIIFKYYKKYDEKTKEKDKNLVMYLYFSYYRHKKKIYDFLYKD